MRKKRSLVIYFFLLTSSLFSEEKNIPLTIADPIDNYSNYDFNKFLDERNYSTEKGELYLEFQNRILEPLDKIIDNDQYFDLIGQWIPENHTQSDNKDFFDFYFDKMIIGSSERNDPLWLQLNGSQGAWYLYRYGEYIISTIPLMGGIGPLLLMYIKENKCFFYFLNENKWELLPYHRNGEVYLRKVNSISDK